MHRTGWLARPPVSGRLRSTDFGRWLVPASDSFLVPQGLVWLAVGQAEATFRPQAEAMKAQQQKIDDLTCRVIRLEAQRAC
jgi:hypothetical protein